MLTETKEKGIKKMQLTEILASQGIVVMLLGVAIVWLSKRNKSVENENKELREELILNANKHAREFLDTLYKNLTILEKYDANDTTNHKELITEIRELKNDVLIKLAELR